MTLTWLAGYLGNFLLITLFILWSKRRLIGYVKWSTKAVWQMDNPQDNCTYSFWFALATLEREGITGYTLLCSRLLIAIGFVKVR